MARAPYSSFGRRSTFLLAFTQREHTCTPPPPPFPDLKKRNVEYRGGGKVSVSQQETGGSPHSFDAIQPAAFPFIGKFFFLPLVRAKVWWTAEGKFFNFNISGSSLPRLLFFFFFFYKEAIVSCYSKNFLHFVFLPIFDSFPNNR